MEKALALQVMDTIRAAETHVTTLETLSVEIADEQERKEFRRHLAEVMLGYIDIERLIVRQYPDLEPGGEPAASSGAAGRSTEP
jgi:hypothetical protein